MCNCSENYDELSFHVLTKAINRPNARKLRRMERTLQRKVDDVFEEQQKQLMRAYRRYDKTKNLDDDVDELLDAIDYAALTAVVLVEARKAMKFGADYRIRKMRLAQFGIAFDLEHPLAVQYLATDRLLVLSKMADTTKEDLRPILMEAARTGQSPQQTAKLIAEATAFSKDRSLMIATNEIGQAYEHGNYIPMKDMEDQGNAVFKQWATVRDDRVTRECRENERKRWIKLDATFPSGDDVCPRNSNPRCRCTTLYEIRN